MSKAWLNIWKLRQLDRTISSGGKFNSVQLVIKKLCNKKPTLADSRAQLGTNCSPSGILKFTKRCLTSHSPNNHSYSKQHMIRGQFVESDSVLYYQKVQITIKNTIENVANPVPKIATNSISDPSCCLVRPVDISLRSESNSIPAFSCKIAAFHMTSRADRRIWQISDGRRGWECAERGVRSNTHRVVHLLLCPGACTARRFNRLR